MSWGKKDISFQCQLVQSRNGVIAIAISDKRGIEDNDCDDVFMTYNTGTHSFEHNKRLCCYSEDLLCELSLHSVLNRIDDVIDEKGNKSDLTDSEWDVMKQARYSYPLDAFKMLTCGKIYWMWSRVDT